VFEGRSQMLRTAAMKSGPAPEGATGHPGDTDSLFIPQPDEAKG